MEQTRTRVATLRTSFIMAVALWSMTCVCSTGQIPLYGVEQPIQEMEVGSTEEIMDVQPHTQEPLIYTSYTSTKWRNTLEQFNKDLSDLHIKCPEKMKECVVKKLFGELPKLLKLFDSEDAEEIVDFIWLSDYLVEWEGDVEYLLGLTLTEELNREKRIRPTAEKGLHLSLEKLSEDLSIGLTNPLREQIVGTTLTVFLMCKLLVANSYVHLVDYTENFKNELYRKKGKPLSKSEMRKLKKSISILRKNPKRLNERFRDIVKYLHSEGDSKMEFSFPKFSDEEVDEMSRKNFLPQEVLNALVESVIININKLGEALSSHSHSGKALTFKKTKTLEYLERMLYYGVKDPNNNKKARETVHESIDKTMNGSTNQPNETEVEKMEDPSSAELGGKVSAQETSSMGSTPHEIEEQSISPEPSVENNPPEISPSDPIASTSNEATGSEKRKAGVVGRYEEERKHRIAEEAKKSQAQAPSKESSLQEDLPVADPNVSTPSTVDPVAEAQEIPTHNNPPEISPNDPIASTSNEVTGSKKRKAGVVERQEKAKKLKMLEEAKKNQAQAPSKESSLQEDLPVVEAQEPSTSATFRNPKKEWMSRVDQETPAVEEAIGEPEQPLPQVNPMPQPMSSQDTPGTSTQSARESVDSIIKNILEFKPTDESFLKSLKEFEEYPERLPTEYVDALSGNLGFLGLSSADCENYIWSKIEDMENNNIDTMIIKSDTNISEAYKRIGESEVNENFRKIEVFGPGFTLDFAHSGENSGEGFLQAAIRPREEKSDYDFRRNLVVFAIKLSYLLRRKVILVPNSIFMADPDNTAWWISRPLDMASPQEGTQHTEMSMVKLFVPRKSGILVIETTSDGVNVRRYCEEKTAYVGKHLNIKNLTVGDISQDQTFEITWHEDNTATIQAVEQVASTTP